MMVALRNAMFEQHAPSCLCIASISTNSLPTTISLKSTGTPPNIGLIYSLNGGSTWKNFDIGSV